MTPFKLLTLENQLTDRWLNYYEAVYQNHEHQLIHYHFVSRQADLTVNTLKQPLKAAAVGIFCLNQDASQVLLVKQFRLPLNDYIYGSPAGLIDPGETVEQTIQREIQEETGYQHVTVQQIFKPSYSTPGITDGAITQAICVITDATPGKAHLEAAEALDAVWVDRQTAQRILDHEKVSGRTQLLLWQWINGGLTLPSF